MSIPKCQNFSSYSDVIADCHKRAYKDLKTFLLCCTALVIAVVAIVTFQSYYATCCFSSAVAAGLEAGRVFAGLILSSQIITLIIKPAEL